MWTTRHRISHRAPFLSCDYVGGHHDCLRIPKFDSILCVTLPLKYLQHVSKCDRSGILEKQLLICEQSNVSGSNRAECILILQLRNAVQSSSESLVRLKRIDFEMPTPDLSILRLIQTLLVTNQLDGFVVFRQDCTVNSSQYLGRSSFM